MSESSTNGLGARPVAVPDAGRERRRVAFVFGAIAIGFLLGVGLLLSVVLFGL